MTGENFIEVDFCQKPKHGQRVCGDVYLTRKLKEEGRIVTVLSDGLGSGVKATVLSSLTATMALRYTAAFEDVRRGARMIMDTLPICKERKISYSTFTIVDLHEDGHARVIEHGNPPLVLLRGTEAQPLDRVQFTLDKWKDRTIHYTEFQVQLGDRIVFCSDGVNQSGMGRRGFPLGWGIASVTNFLSQQIVRNTDLSAADLSRAVIQVALTNDGQIAKDDMTCGVIYYRRPRRLLVISGPPFNQERDQELADMIRRFPGRKAICGGTTANIISRLLGRPVRMSLARLDPDVPPASAMDGVDLVTEGTLTLARVAELLEHNLPSEGDRPNPARDLASLMLASDIVHFVVGTRINEAHQDPSVPVELDLRRNIVRKIAALLERDHLKGTRIQFV